MFVQSMSHAFKSCVGATVLAWLKVLLITHIPPSTFTL